MTRFAFSALLTKTVRRIALMLNVFLVVSVIWAAIILLQQLLPGEVLAGGLIKIVAAGAAVVAIASPNGRTRRRS